MGVVYLDTSALVKLYAAEEHSAWVRGLVRGTEGTGNSVAASAVSYVEARAALAAKKRSGAIRPEHANRAEYMLFTDFRDLLLVRPVSEGVLLLAAELPSRCGLRAYDAVQLATALAMRRDLEELAVTETVRMRRSASPLEPPPPDIESEDLLLLSFDRDLHDACVAEGIAHAHPDRAGGRVFRAP